MVQAPGLCSVIPGLVSHQVCAHALGQWRPDLQGRGRPGLQSSPGTTHSTSEKAPQRQGRQSTHKGHRGQLPEVYSPGEQQLWWTPRRLHPVQHSAPDHGRAHKGSRVSCVRVPNSTRHTWTPQMAVISAFWGTPPSSPLVVTGLPCWYCQSRIPPTVLGTCSNNSSKSG